MQFVIAGGGRVGARTARVLQGEGHEVTIVELDPMARERCESNGLRVVAGDGAREDALLEAGIDVADGFAGLTRDLTTNFAGCMIAKHHGCRTVLRIDEDYREDIYRKYATEVDEIVYPERLGAIGAKNAILGGNIRAIADIARNLQIVEMTVTDASPMVGYTMEELQLPGNATTLAYGSADDSLTLPEPDTTLAVGDKIAVLADFEVLSEIRQLIVGTDSSPIVGSV